MSYQSTFAENEAVTLPTTSTKTGYAFGGWYTNSDLTGSSVTTIPSGTTTNQTFYAKWNLTTYSITYTLNGGSLPTSYDTSYTILDNVTLPTPTYTNYHFMGWFNNSSYTGDAVPSILTGTSGNQNYYAKWEPYNANDFQSYMESILPITTEESLTLPTTYQGLTISWTSDQSSVINNSGIYHRPYQGVNVTLTAIVTGQGTTTQTYEVYAKGYKVLTTGIASSYIYREYSTVTPEFFDTLDIINCAFITANANGSLSGSTVLNNITTCIMPQAHAQGDWVIASIAPSSEWSTIAASPTLVITFANNIVTLINTYGFDGVDIDWEFPATGEETLFTAMMTVIYQKVKANNPHHLVTAAIGAGMWQPPHYDLVNSKQYIDYINMMAYDMASNTGYYQNALYRQTTLHNTTYAVGKTLTSCSIAESVVFLNTNYAISYSKIIVGIPFYGVKQTRTYTNGTWSAWAKSSTPYYDTLVADYIGSSNYTEYYDSGAQVPYLVKNDGTEFISYDNPTSVAAKCQYVLDQQLGGIMYWENGCDSTGTLLASMKTTLGK